MTTHTLVQKLVLVTEECCNCGVTFAMPDYMVDRLRRTKDYFYCPNGHSQHYTGKSDSQLRQEAEAQVMSMRDQLRATEKDAKAKIAAAKAETTRLRNRVEKGVCPHCQRSFVQLERHVRSKHPECAGA